MPVSTWLDLGCTLARRFPCAPQATGWVRHVEARNEVIHAYADHVKARRVFGARPSVRLEEGVRRMSDWAKQMGARSSNDFGQIEVTRGLPPSWAEGSKRVTR